MIRVLQKRGVITMKMQVYHHRLPYIITAVAAFAGAIILAATLAIIFSLERVPDIAAGEPVRFLLWQINPFLARNIGIAVWAIGPPFWFWFEYFYLFKNYGNPGDFEEFKHGQQVSASIWAGVVGFLVAFYKL